MVPACGAKIHDVARPATSARLASVTGSAAPLTMAPQPFATVPPFVALKKVKVERDEGQDNVDTEDKSGAATWDHVLNHPPITSEHQFSDETLKSRLQPERATSDVIPHTSLASSHRLLCSAFLLPGFLSLTLPTPGQNPSRRRRRRCRCRTFPQWPCETRAGKHFRDLLLSPASRHEGEAIDRQQAPPPPPDAAAEQAGSSHELQLPADISWERLDKSRFFALGAGLFSAVSAALYPAVVLKTRLQVAPEPPPAHAAAGAGAGLPPSAAAAATTILRREGPLAFYRGFATSLAGTVPARALYMGALEATRSAVGPTVLRLGAPEPAASAFAGAAAGLTAAIAAQVVWTPVDVISQRLMVQGNPCPDSRYRGGLDAFRKIIASDGPRGLYRGFGVSILTYAPSNAVWWATYSLSQKIIWSGTGCYLCQYGVGVKEIDDGDGDSSLQPDCRTVMVVQGVSAAMAGGAAALVTMPLDTIKTRMQVMDGEGEPVTVGRTVRRLIKEGGWGACYRGLGPRWASMSLSATTMITTYEFIKRLSVKGQESGLA